MDYRVLAALLLKIVGAVLLFWYIAWLPEAISRAIQTQSIGQSLLFVFLPGVVPLVLGYFFFAFPAKITNRLLRGEPLSTDTRFVRGLELLALRLIGAFYLFRGAVDLCYHLARAFARNRMGDASQLPSTVWFSADEFAGLVSPALEMVIAAWLLVGTKGIVDAVARLRGRE